MTRMGLLAVALAMIGLGCGEEGRRIAVTALADLQEPVTYEGVVRHCPDCGESLITLTLRPDRVFFLREKAVDLGRWKLNGSSSLLTLLGGQRYPYEFEVRDVFRLRVLGPDGLPMEIDGGQDLFRAADVDSFGEPMRMRGMYRFREGNVVFTECRTSVRWPVAPEGASAELEQAYWRARREPGQRLLMNVTARFVRHGDEEVLVVERLHRVDPEHDCSDSTIPRRATRPQRRVSRPAMSVPWGPPPGPTRDPGLEELEPSDPLRRIQNPPVPTDPRTTSG